MLNPKDKIWLRTPLSIPATKRDVYNLFQKLEKRLKVEYAKESGICPIRDRIYSECFDEIVRQVTINYKKRGKRYTQNPNLDPYKK